MSEFDDLDGVTQPPIPEEAVEQLLRGTWTGTDGGEDFADIADIFRAARASGDATELASLEATVAAFRHEAGAHITNLTTARKRPMYKKYLTAKTAAVVGVLTFATAGAAAATGSFPSFSGSRPRIESPKDDATADTDVEDSVVDDTVVQATDGDDTDVDDTVAATDDTTAATDTADSSAVESAANDDEAQGPDATGPAKFGLCTAYSAHAKHDTADDATPTASSVADEDDLAQLPIPFQNLEDAATAAGQTVDEFCADATPAGKPADENGDSAHGKSGDNPSATAPGHTEEDASVTEPVAPDDNPSVTAPGHADDDSSSTPHGGGDKPADTAPGRSSGHGRS